MYSADLRLGPIGNQLLVNLVLEESPREGVVLRVFARAPGPLLGVGDIELRGVPTPARQVAEGWALVEVEEEPSPEAAPSRGPGPSTAGGPAARAEAASAPHPTSSGAASSGSAQAPLAAQPPRGELPARFYVVVQVPAGCQLAWGIYFCSWTRLEQRLPGGRLAGSRVRLWGYDARDAAVARWYEQGHEDDPVDRLLQ